MLVEFLDLFKAFGLVGLMVGVVAALAFVFFWLLEKKDTKHHSHINKIIEDERELRKETNERFATSTDKLSDALRDLTKSLRNNHD